MENTSQPYVHLKAVQDENGGLESVVIHQSSGDDSLDAQALQILQNQLAARPPRPYGSRIDARVSFDS